MKKKVKKVKKQSVKSTKQQLIISAIIIVVAIVGVAIYSSIQPSGIQEGLQGELATLIGGDVEDIELYVDGWTFPVNGITNVDVLRLDVAGGEYAGTKFTIKTRRLEGEGTPDYVYQTCPVEFPGEIVEAGSFVTFEVPLGVCDGWEITNILVEAMPGDFPGSGNLISHYPFNRNARDSVGNNHGSVRGSPDYVEGISNKAIKLYGSEDYVYIGDKFDNLNEGFAISVWIKLDKDALGTLNYVFWKSDDKPGLLILEDGRVDVKPGPRSTTKLEEGKWYHIVYTFDGSVSKVYINGKLENLGNVSSFSPGGTVRIGRDEKSSRYERHFDGEIDDLRIYNNFLIESEILALYYEFPNPLKVTRTIENLGGNLYSVSLDIDVNENIPLNAFIISEYYPYWWEIQTVSHGGIWNESYRYELGVIEWLGSELSELKVEDGSVSYTILKTDDNIGFWGEWITTTPESNEPILGDYLA